MPRKHRPPVLGAIPLGATPRPEAGPSFESVNQAGPSGLPTPEAGSSQPPSPEAGPSVILSSAAGSSVFFSSQAGPSEGNGSKDPREGAREEKAPILRKRVR